MNESVDERERELFILKQRLLEAQLAREESDRLKERLRDMAASVASELRMARARIDVLEAHVRRLERENTLLAERVAPGTAVGLDVRESLVHAHEELVAAHEYSNDCELLVDSLQLQLYELRAELATARGFEPSARSSDG